MTGFSKLNSSILNKLQTNNVLRTTYRVIDPIGADDKKKYSLSKTRPSQIINIFETKRLSK